MVDDQLGDGGDVDGPADQILDAPHGRQSRTRAPVRASEKPPEIIVM